MLSVCQVAGWGAGTKEESGEIWTLVTLRRLPLVTTRPQHHPGVGVAGLLMAGAQLERSCKKRMPPLGCTSPPPQPRNPGRIPRLNRDLQPPGGGRRVNRYSSERQQGMAGRILNGFNLQFQSRQNWGLLRRGHWPVLHLWLRKVGLQALRRPFFAVMPNKTNSLQSE